MTILKSEKTIARNNVFLIVNSEKEDSERGKSEKGKDEKGQF